MSDRANVYGARTICHRNTGHLIKALRSYPPFDLESSRAPGNKLKFWSRRGAHVNASFYFLAPGIPRARRHTPCIYDVNDGNIFPLAGGNSGHCWLGRTTARLRYFNGGSSTANPQRTAPPPRPSLVAACFRMPPVTSYSEYWAWQRLNRELFSFTIQSSVILCVTAPIEYKSFR